MARDGTVLRSQLPNGQVPETDIQFLRQLRAGDVEAGHRFVRDQYPGVFRYLLYLTGHRETAEDLTQETFLLAWRHLDQFQGRAELRLWLHQIARRQFLRTRRFHRPIVSLDEVAEFPELHARPGTDEVELRLLLTMLPEEQQEVLILHYLEGYSSGEIAQIIQAPASTIRDRLGSARSHLARALRPGDLPYLNEPTVPGTRAAGGRQWAWLPLGQLFALETRLSRGSAGGVPASGPGSTLEETMERREFLRQAAVSAAALALPEAEKEVVDSRLTQRVTGAFKGTALSDLCEKLKSDTGIPVTAGPSVADEKVTLFCEKLPLREVMRQLSRPFGYTWLRSGKLGEYKYELIQDLRSQLLEEELRNRDRNAALLALEAEMEPYRPYLDLSPEEGLARSRTAGAAEKKRLEKLAGPGWGPIHMYFRLTPPQLAALRAGRTLTFSQEPRPAEEPLPIDIAHGVFQIYRDLRIRRDGERMAIGGEDEVPGGLPPASIPEARAIVTLTLAQNELGLLTLDGESGVGIAPGMAGTITGGGPYATGRDPKTLQPCQPASNARLASTENMRAPVTIQPRASYRSVSSAAHPDEIKVSSADVLEALHRATGLPIVADYFTRLYPAYLVSVTQQPLFEALNQLAGAMRLRWTREGNTGESPLAARLLGSAGSRAWLHFRSASYYDGRAKEVPNRLLAHWAAARQARGALSLAELLEIAQLSDAQLDAADVAEGVKACFGLAEWDVARNRRLRPHLRCLALLNPAQRKRAMGAAGLRFTDLTVAQQQSLVSLALAPYLRAMKSESELAGIVVRVGYSQPDEFSVALPGGPWTRPLALQLIRERSPAAALQAARRLDPGVDAAEIVPAALAVTVAYQWGEPPTGGGIIFVRATSAGFLDRFHRFP